MGLLWLDDFGQDRTLAAMQRQYVGVQGIFPLPAVTGRQGGLCLHHEPPSSTALVFLTNQVQVVPSIDTICLGFGIRYGAVTIDHDIVSILSVNGGKNKLSMTMLDGLPTLALISGSTTIGTYSFFRFNDWYYIELLFRYDPTPSLRRFEMRVNGDTVLSGTSENVQTLTVPWNQVVFSPRAATSSWLELDDLYIRDDETFMGPVTVCPLFPHTVSGHPSFVPVTNLVTDINEGILGAIDDTTYVSSLQVSGTDKVLYLWTYPEGQGRILAEQMQLDDANFDSTSQVWSQRRSLNAQLWDSAPIALVNGSIRRQKLFLEISPFTDLPLTQDEVRATIVGVT